MQLIELFELKREKVLEDIGCRIAERPLDFPCFSLNSHYLPFLQDERPDSFFA